MDPSKKASYFEQMCEGIQNAPFKTDLDKRMFQVSLKEWPNFRKEDPEVSQLLSSRPPLEILAEMKVSEVNLKVISNSIQKIECDAIVNAGNTSLLGGGGIDQAIHEGAGSVLLRECSYLGGCQISECKLTKGYLLPATYVIQTSGPTLDEDEKPEPQKLADCYINALKLCHQYGLTSIAFPSISTGFYGYPVPQASKIAIESVVDYAPKMGVKTVYFANPDKPTFAGPSASGTQHSSTTDPGKTLASGNSGGYRRVGTAAGPASTQGSYNTTTDPGKALPSGTSGGYRRVGTAAGPTSTQATYNTTTDPGKALPSGTSGGYRRVGTAAGPTSTQGSYQATTDPGKALPSGSGGNYRGTATSTTTGPASSTSSMNSSLDPGLSAAVSGTGSAPIAKKSCPSCGQTAEGKFCGECGQSLQ